MPRKSDPLAILGDLEIDLMLSFLSVPETIVIRGVSTLWKARVEFRLTSGAILRHYPTSEEAQAIYCTRADEVSAFKKAAHRHETHAEPSIALVFRKLHDEVFWCICNNHMVKTYEREWLHIQQVFDPKNPQRKHFPVRSLCIKNLPQLGGATRSGFPLKIQWTAGHDTTDTIVLHVGADSPHLNNYNPRWILAISVTNGRVIWCHKAKIASDTQPWNLIEARSIGPPASLGNGNVCIVDIKGNLTVLNLATGQQKAHAHLLDHGGTSFSARWAQRPGYRLIAHPTMELCFAVINYALLVISTETAQVIKTLEFNKLYPSTQGWLLARFHFGKKPITEGGGEMVWLLCNDRPVPADVIVSYEIDLEKLELAQVAVWRVAHYAMILWTIQNSLRLSRNDVEEMPEEFYDVCLRLLNPVTRMGFICLQRIQDYQIRSIKFKQTAVVAPTSDGSKYPVTIFEIENHQYITLPEKTIKTSGNGRTKTDTTKKNNEPRAPHGRREFILQTSPSALDMHFSERYMAFSTQDDIYLFGFVPRW